MSCPGSFVLKKNLGDDVSEELFRALLGYLELFFNTI
jgi:hypothetical protein